MADGVCTFTRTMCPARTTTDAEARQTDTPRPDGSPTEQLPKDQLFHLLQNERRRAALCWLRELECRSDIRTLADEVAAAENDTSVDALDSEARQRVYISLYQSHLPKLDSLGVVDYDQEEGTVERTRVAKQLDPYLHDDEADHPSSGDDDSHWWKRARSTGETPATVLGGILLGLGVSSASAWLIVGATLLVTMATSRWLTDLVAAVGA